MALYDYIYVDLEKVISLYSQLIGGVVDVREVNKERVHSADNKRHYDLKVFKHDAGGTDQDKTGLKETIKPHHSVLMELEEELTRNGYLVNINDQAQAQSLRDPIFRTQLKSTLCPKVCGRAVIEDYARLKAIALAHPEIVQLINKSAQSNLKTAPEYLEYERRVARTRQEIKQTKNRADRARKEQQLRTLEKSAED
jgi:hypothetical protein